jgi:hypothetical protein
MQSQIPLTQYLAWGVMAFGLGFYFSNTFTKTKNSFVQYFLVINLLFFLSFYFTMGI